MSLNIEATLRALCAAAGIEPVENDDPVPTTPPGDWGQHGASHIPEAQAYFDSLTAQERAWGNLPTGDGPVYAITDDSVARNPGAVGDVLRQNQNHVWALFIEDPRIYIAAANYAQDAGGSYFGPNEGWTRIVAFAPGVKDADVAAAFKWRVESNRGTNPGQKFG